MIYSYNGVIIDLLTDDVEEMEIRKKLLEREYLLEMFRHKLKYKTIPFISAYTEYLNHYAITKEQFKTNRDRVYMKGILNIVPTVQEFCSQSTLNIIMSNISNLAEDTKQRYFIYIKEFIRYCIKKEYIPADVFDKLEFPKYVKKPRKVFMSYDVIDKINAYTLENDIDLYYVINFLLHTGLRIGEITKLKKKDIYDNGILTNIYVEREKTKSKNKVLTIIPDSLKTIISSYVETLDNDAFLFVGHNQAVNYYPMKFLKMKKKLNIPSEYSLHTLRKTYAQKLYDKTGDLLAVSKLLNHSTVMMTQKHYLSQELTLNRIDNITSIINS